MKTILKKLRNTVIGLGIVAVCAGIVIGLGCGIVYFPISTGIILILGLAWCVGEAVVEGKW